MVQVSVKALENGERRECDILRAPIRGQGTGLEGEVDEGAYHGDRGDAQDAPPSRVRPGGYVCEARVGIVVVCGHDMRNE